MKSTKRAMPAVYREREMQILRQAINDLVEVEAPNRVACKVVNDVVNMCRVFVEHNGGVWKGAHQTHARKITLADDTGLIRECIQFFGPVAWEAIQTDGNLNISAEQGAMLLDLADIYEEIVSELTEAEVQKCKNIVAQYYKSLGPVRRKVEQELKGELDAVV